MNIYLLVIALFLSLSACADAPQDAQLPVPVIIDNKKPLDIDALSIKAAQGDKVAQYELGREFCCANPRDNIPNAAAQNDEVTGWLCAAAHAGLPAAQLRLGELYSGDLFNLPSWEDYIPSKRKDDVRLPLVLALMWYELAAENQQAEAMGQAIRHKNRLTEGEVAASRLLKQNWKAAPCRWGDVI